MRRNRGFTLIELLVVIAILSLLVSILIPAIGKARMAGRKVISVANLGQINAASRMYADDNKGFMPITGTTTTRGIGNPGEPVSAWCTWSFGGKNNDGYWYTYQAGYFDVEAADRPLNPYLYPEIVWEAPDPPGRLAANHPARKTQEAPVFRDPSDKFTRQRTWPNETPTISSYDDVGTSYHWNYYWYYRPPAGIPVGNRSFQWGTRQMRIAENFMSARFVWVYDQIADVIVHPDHANRSFVNGYGDINRAILGFLDGHAAYMPMRSGQQSGPGYTLLFQFQRRDNAP